MYFLQNLHTSLFFQMYYQLGMKHSNMSLRTALSKTITRWVNEQRTQLLYQWQCIPMLMPYQLKSGWWVQWADHHIWAAWISCCHAFWLRGWDLSPWDCAGAAWDTNLVTLMKGFSFNFDQKHTIDCAAQRCFWRDFTRGSFTFHRAHISNLRAKGQEFLSRWLSLFYFIFLD